MHTKHFILGILAFVSAQSVQAQGASSYQWASLPFGGGGFVTGIITSEQEANVIYVRTDVGGTYRWTESTKTWKPLNDNLSESECGLMGAESMAVDPSKPSRVYLYCGTSYFNGGKSAILCSDDYGDTWSTKAIVTSMFPANGNGTGRQTGERLAVDPNENGTLICGSRTRGLWRSYEFGSSWTRIGQTQFPNSQAVGFVQFVASSGTKGKPTPVVYASVQAKNTSNLFVSEDGGDSWTAVEGQRTDYIPHRCTMDGNYLYITYTDNVDANSTANGAVMRYDMKNKTWADISPAGKYPFGEVSVVRGKSNCLMVTTVGKWMGQYWAAGHTTWGDHIFVSSDGGANWTNLMSSKKARYVETNIPRMMSSAQLHWCGSSKIDPFNENRAFFISGNGLYATDNLWDTNPIFHTEENGIEETVPLGICNVKDGPFGVCVGDCDGGLYDDVTTYPRSYSPGMGSENEIAIAPMNPLRMVRSAKYLYSSSDGGVTWTKLTIPNTTFGSYGVCAISSGGKIIVDTPNGSKPYFTLDDGKTWTMLDVAGSGAVLHGDGAIEGVFYSLSNSVFYVYKIDAATGIVTYTSTPIGNVSSPRRLGVVPGMSGELWLARSSYGLMHLQNAHLGADKMTSSSLSLTSAPTVGVGKSSTPDGYPALYLWGKPRPSDVTGMYRSDDKGVSWTRINDDQHQFGGPGNAYMVSGDMNYYGRVYMTTVGRGVICGRLLDETTSITSAGLDRHTTVLRAGYSYAIYSSAGMMVKRGTVSADADVSTGLPHGLYIVQVMCNGNKETFKFIK